MALTTETVKARVKGLSDTVHVSEAEILRQCLDRAFPAVRRKLLADAGMSDESTI
jgi:hypothetical protein